MPQASRSSGLVWRIARRGHKAEAKLANVECTLYPHGRADVGALRRAISELAARV